MIGWLLGNTSDVDKKNMLGQLDCHVLLISVKLKKLWLNTSLTSFLFSDSLQDAVGGCSNIESVIFYDSHWTTKDDEKKITKSLSEKYSASEHKHSLNVYRLITKDTLEEKVAMMDIPDGLDKDSREEVVGLLKHKASTILNMDRESTMDLDADIEGILNDDTFTMDGDTEGGDGDLSGEIQRKYTMKDIMNHPENQGVIRLFVAVFAAVIIVPLCVVFVVHRYVFPHCLLEWTEYGKQNLLVFIGVGVAHLIGVLYACYAWSGEDRTPAHILDAREEAEHGLDENAGDEKTEKESPKSSGDDREYMLVDKGQGNTATAKDARSGRNQVRKRSNRRRSKRKKKGNAS